MDNKSIDTANNISTNEPSDNIQTSNAVIDDNDLCVFADYPNSNH
jgi:hypothetical protein